MKLERKKSLKEKDIAKILDWYGEHPSSTFADGQLFNIDKKGNALFLVKDDETDEYVAYFCEKGKKTYSLVQRIFMRPAKANGEERVWFSARNGELYEKEPSISLEDLKKQAKADELIEIFKQPNFASGKGKFKMAVKLQKAEEQNQEDKKMEKPTIEDLTRNILRDIGIALVAKERSMPQAQSETSKKKELVEFAREKIAPFVEKFLPSLIIKETEIPVLDQAARAAKGGDVDYSAFVEKYRNKLAKDVAEFVFHSIGEELSEELWDEKAIKAQKLLESQIDYATRLANKGDYSDDDIKKFAAKLAKVFFEEDEKAAREKTEEEQAQVEKEKSDFITEKQAELKEAAKTISDEMILKGAVSNIVKKYIDKKSADNIFSAQVQETIKKSLQRDVAGAGKLEDKLVGFLCDTIRKANSDASSQRILRNGQTYFESIVRFAVREQIAQAKRELFPEQKPVEEEKRADFEDLKSAADKFFAQANPSVIAFVQKAENKFSARGVVYPVSLGKIGTFKKETKERLISVADLKAYAKNAPYTKLDAVYVCAAAMANQIIGKKLDQGVTIDISIEERQQLFGYIFEKLAKETLTEKDRVTILSDTAELSEGMKQDLSAIVKLEKEATAILKKIEAEELLEKRPTAVSDEEVAAFVQNNPIVREFAKQIGVEGTSKAWRTYFLHRAQQEKPTTKSASGSVTITASDKKLPSVEDIKKTLLDRSFDRRYKEAEEAFYAMTYADLLKEVNAYPVEQAEKTAHDWWTDEVIFDGVVLGPSIFGEDVEPEDQLDALTDRCVDLIIKGKAAKTDTTKIYQFALDEAKRILGGDEREAKRYFKYLTKAVADKENEAHKGRTTEEPTPVEEEPVEEPTPVEQEGQAATAEKPNPVEEPVEEPTPVEEEPVEEPTQKPIVETQNQGFTYVPNGGNQYKDSTAETGTEPKKDADRKEEAKGTETTTTGGNKGIVKQETVRSNNKKPKHGNVKKAVAWVLVAASAVAGCGAGFGIAQLFIKKSEKQNPADLGSADAQKVEFTLSADEQYDLEKFNITDGTLTIDEQIKAKGVSVEDQTTYAEAFGQTLGANAGAEVAAVADLKNETAVVSMTSAEGLETSYSVAYPSADGNFTTADDFKSDLKEAGLTDAMASTVADTYTDSFQTAYAENYNADNFKKDPPVVEKSALDLKSEASKQAVFNALSASELTFEGKTYSVASVDEIKTIMSDGETVFVHTENADETKLDIAIEGLSAAALKEQETFEEELAAGETKITITNVEEKVVTPPVVDHNANRDFAAALQGVVEGTVKDGFVEGNKVYIITDDDQLYEKTLPEGTDTSALDNAALKAAVANAEETVVYNGYNEKDENQETELDNLASLTDSKGRRNFSDEQMQKVIANIQSKIAHAESVEIYSVCETPTTTENGWDYAQVTLKVVGRGADGKVVGTTEFTGEKVYAQGQVDTDTATLLTVAACGGMTGTKAENKDGIMHGYGKKVLSSTKSDEITK